MMRLPMRLFLSYTTVVLVGGGVAYLTIFLLAPRLFDVQLGMMSGGPASMIMANATATSVRSAFQSALTTALIVGVLASVVVAVFLAAAFTRRLLRPLDAVRVATKQIAAGNYGGSVPVSSQPELAALATDVNTLAHALADTESRRTRLLGEVAHEMRTPLTVLDGYVEGLIDGVFTATPDTLASLSEELRRLHRLADDLSSLSRAQEQTLELHPVNADLAAIARRAAARLTPQFEDSGVTLINDSEEPLPVRVDPDRITQLLTNLLGNALIATSNGGTVTISVRGIGGRGEIVVTDTGVGLTAEDMERIFERFYRAPEQSRKSAGSGIGLTIAREIARGHGGDVTVSSPGPGHGSSFLFALPLRESGR
ncbi:ATP-binding protein [soil metagenome]